MLVKPKAILNQSSRPHHFASDGFFAGSAITPPAAITAALIAKTANNPKAARRVSTLRTANDATAKAESTTPIAVADKPSAWPWIGR